MKHNQYIKIYTGYPDDVQCQISREMHADVNAGLRIASINTNIINPQEGDICVTVVYERFLPNVTDDADELGYLIAKLEQYAKEELNAHNSCVAEDLQAAADKLKEIGERR